MMRSTRVFQKTDDTIISFSLLSAPVRIGYGIMAAVIGAASVLVYAEQHRIPFWGTVLGLFSLFALCYKDRWRFNCTAKTAEYSIGLVFCAYTKRYTFADIEKTETDYFTKGFRNQAYMKCRLCFKTGGQKTVAVFPVQRNQSLVRRWETLAAFFTGKTDGNGAGRA